MMKMNGDRGCHSDYIPAMHTSELFALQIYTVYVIGPSMSVYYYSLLVDNLG